MPQRHEVDGTGRVVRRSPAADNQAGDPTQVDAVTGRPPDTPTTAFDAGVRNSTFASRKAGDAGLDPAPAPERQSTLASRKQARDAEDKRVDAGDVEDKGVKAVKARGGRR